MGEFTVERCRSCDDEIIWCETTRGKAMPVDKEPSRDGNVRLTDRTHLHLKPLAEVLPPAKCFGKTQLRLAHFVRCKQASAWRQRGAA